MEFVGRGFGGGIAFALAGDDVKQDGAAGGFRTIGITQVAQDGEEVIEVVTVDGADIVEAHFLEQGAAGEHAAREFLGAAGGAFDGFRKALGHPRRKIAQAEEGIGREQPRKIGAHGADRGGDRHVVVVEDDDEAGMQRAGVVHRLVGHAGTHRAIADDGNDMAVVLDAACGLEVAAHGHAEAGGDRGGGMGGTEGVVFALRAPGEAGEATPLAQGADPVAPAGQDLVGVALVADIPDQAVIRGVEGGVDGECEFDDAERGAEMAAGGGDGVDGFGAEFVSEVFELVGGEVAQIRRDPHPVQKRRSGPAGGGRGQRGVHRRGS